MMFPKTTRLRSEKHRRNVSKLSCIGCGRDGPCQVAHANYGKGMGLKACDSQTFPMCPDCHRYHDTGGIPKETRRNLEVAYVSHTRSELIDLGLWPDEVEQAHKKSVGILQSW